MLTRLKPTFPKPTGDAVKDYSALVAAMEEFWRRLDAPNVLTIDAAKITATNGIVFPSDTLSDYDVAANWTPVASYATVGTSSWAPTLQVGDATKIGREVRASFRYAGVPTNGTGAGNLQITGLPFTPATDTNFIWDGALVYGGLTLTGSRTSVACSLVSGSPIILFSMMGSAVAPANVTVSDVPTGGNVVLRGTLRYRV